MDCRTCGAQVAPGDRFCSACGTELQQRDERRVVTVVFADLVGFTTYSEHRDPERVKNVVDTCFVQLADEIRSFGGQVDKVVGDAIIALFGAPTAHEDDAERAVRAALRMQEAVRRQADPDGMGLTLRIGVNTGEVLVGAIRAGGDYTAMGDTVNAASRLQELAEPGTVLVGESTYEATRDSIHYEVVGSITVRGREDSIRVWRAVRPVGLPGQRSHQHGPLVGRAPEQRLLRSAVDAAVLRRRAHFLLVYGEAGIGKNRLTHELARYATEHHEALVLAGRCVPYGEADVWFPIAEALRGALRLRPDATPDQAAAAATSAYAGLLGRAPDDPQVERLRDGLVHFLGYDSPLGELDDQRALEEAARAVRVGFQRQTARHPVVLWLTDLHWADEVVLKLLDGLMRAHSDLPLVVLASARPELMQRWMPTPGPGDVISVGLTPLSDDASLQILRSIAGALPETVERDIVDRSGGNPFFLEELGQLVVDGGAGALESVPGTLRGLVSARLDALSPAERSVVENAAVLGRRGPVQAIATMAEHLDGVAGVEAALDHLHEVDILDVDHATWEFRSNLVRDVVYNRLTKTDRAQRHAGVASYLESHAEDADNVIAVIAHHYRRAALLIDDIGPVPGVPDDLRERAIDWTSRAASRARSGEALAVVVGLYTEALEVLGDDPADRGTRQRLLIDRGRTHASASQLAMARHDLAEADRLGPLDPELELAAELARGDIAQRSGHFEESFAHFDRALELARAADDPSAAGTALRMAGLTHLFLGAYTEADRAYTEALDAFASAGDRQGEAWVRQNLAWLSYAHGRARQAEGRIADARELFAELGDDAGVAFADGLLAYIRMHQGRRDESRRLAERVLVEARDRGERWGEGMMTVLLALLALWDGRADEAVRIGERALGLFEEFDDPVGRAQATAVTGRALVRAGRVDEGRRLLARSRFAPDAAQGIDLMVATAAAMAAVTVGDPQGALTELGDDIVPTDDRGTIGADDRLVARALAQLQAGEVERAAALLAAADVLDEDGVRNPNVMASRALAAAVVGDHTLVADLVELVAGSERATFMDRQYADSAAAIVAAAHGDVDGVRRRLDRIVDGVSSTSDRAAELLYRLIAAATLLAVGAPDGAVERERADRLAGVMGVDPWGWNQVLTRALPVLPAG